MKVLVCVKQVPDMESRFTLNAAGNWFDESELVWRMNEYDEFAVEQAVRLKEQAEDVDLTVLSIGPARVKEVIKKALAMGCDRGLHVLDELSFEKGPFEIAATIAEYAREQQFEVIFTGMQSQDRGSAQVGVLIAEMLGIPSVTTVVEFAYETGSIRAKRELEGGVRGAVQVTTPALVSCQLGLNKPRYPTLPNIMKAAKRELVVVPVTALCKVEPVVITERFYFPEKKGKGLVLEGSAAYLADQLIGILREKAAVL